MPKGKLKDIKSLINEFKNYKHSAQFEIFVDDNVSLHFSYYLLL